MAQIRPRPERAFHASVVARPPDRLRQRHQSLLSRAATRQRMSLRAALGASRFQIARQLITESLMYFALRRVRGARARTVAAGRAARHRPPPFPRLDQVSVDLRVLFFTSLVTLATGLLFGLIPAWTASHRHHERAARAGHGAIAGRSWLGTAWWWCRSRPPWCSSSLSACCAGFRRAAAGGRGLHRGEGDDHESTCPPRKYGTIGPDRREARAVREGPRGQAEALPGVESAAVVTTTPLTGGPTFMRVESNINVTPSSAPSPLPHHRPTASGRGHRSRVRPVLHAPRRAGRPRWSS